MDFDVLAVTAVRAAPPPPVAPADRTTAGRPAGQPPATPATPIPTTAPADLSSRRVELSFHEDLRVLITKVINEDTGRVIAQVPADQVLDLVADLMAQIRATEEARP